MAKDSVIANNLAEMGKIKLKARAVLNEFYNYSRIFKPYISEIAARIKRADLPWLSYQEIIKIIDGKKVSISNRHSINWVLAKSKSWKLIKGSNAEKIKKDFEDYFFNKVIHQLTGIPANQGFYKGKVAVIRTIFSDSISEEIKKVKKGHVLVANTTGPEVMSACMLAGAIITDEGGITSHAAVVSRELKIPCIVGTKIATHILKDNDMVEVDAVRGIVRKIR